MDTGTDASANSTTSGADALPSLDDLYRHVRDRLSFLERRDGCHVQKEEDAGIWTKISYVLEELVIVAFIDWRDIHLTLYICRTINGGSPPTELVHEGERVGYRVSAIVGRLGLTAPPDRKRKARKYPTGEERVYNFINQVDREASRLQENFERIATTTLELLRGQGAPPSD